MSHTCRALLAGAVVCGIAGQAQPRANSTESAQASIEDLMNIEITSVAHKEQRAGDVAAAVYVITQEDIRRSGMTTVPELLRLVPGVQVAQINSNKWAVAVRGFNNLFADKLLVLVDGRTVYDRLNSGLFWESLDVPLDQIDRIEVVRGPGGATWGANAVNGVINIVTKSAADLPGGAVSVGRRHVRRRARGRALRRNARHRRLPRVFAVVRARANRGSMRTRRPTTAGGARRTAFRLDWAGGRDAFMVQGGATLASAARTVACAVRTRAGRAEAVRDDGRTRRSTSVLGRWTRRRDNGAVAGGAVLRRLPPQRRWARVRSQIQARRRCAVSHRARRPTRCGRRRPAIDSSMNASDGGFTFSITPE